MNDVGPTVFVACEQMGAQSILRMTEDEALFLRDTLISLLPDEDYDDE